MRRAVIISASVVAVLGVLAGGAFLLLVTTVSCACAEPFPGVTVAGTRTLDGYDLRVEALHGDPARLRTYGGMDVVRGEVGNLTPTEWRATRDGALLGETDEVRVGDVLHVRAAEGERVRLVDVACNCYVATWPAA